MDRQFQLNEPLADEMLQEGLPGVTGQPAPLPKCCVLLEVLAGLGLRPAQGVAKG